MSTNNDAIISIGCIGTGIVHTFIKKLQEFKKLHSDDLKGLGENFNSIIILAFLNNIPLLEKAKEKNILKLGTKVNLYGLPMCRYDAIMCRIASKNGYIHILEWFFSNGCAHNGYTIGKIYCAAAEANNKEIIEWTRKKEEELSTQIYKRGTIGICSNAAYYGHMELLIWLCDMEMNERYDFTRVAPERAAERGQLEILKWLFESRCMITSRICELAAENNQLHILEWLLESETKTGILLKYTNAALFAAKKGRLKVLKWMYKKKLLSIDPLLGSYKSVDLCSNAALGGHIHVLQWLHKKGYQWDEQTCHNAATNGNLELLKWARENDCPWNEETSLYAANGGHLKILEWLHENGCALHPDICCEAVKHKHYEILKWGYEKGCKLNSEICMCIARKGDVEMLIWIIDHGCQIDRKNVAKRLENDYKKAIDYGVNIWTPVIEWLNQDV